jgi:hypothetical protein
MAEQDNQQQTVTRTYRAAVRLGEDFVTLEETITLPLQASDDEIQQAVSLGWRIYQAQQESLEAQVASLRESRPAASAPGSRTIRNPEAPASDKQRQLIGTLQQNLHWSEQQLAAHAMQRGTPLAQLTKGQASAFIDDLKRLTQEATDEQPGTGEGSRISERQYTALRDLAQRGALDLAQEVRQRFGKEVSELSAREAGDLLNEWQRP